MVVNYKAIDVMKFICSILIVIIHANPFGKSFISFIMFNNNTRIAVPLFFITSGYLVWGKYKNDKIYISKYIYKLVKISIIWTIVYLPYNIYDFNYVFT